MNEQCVEEKYMWPENEGEHSITSDQNSSVRMRISFFYPKLPMTYMVVRNVLLHHAIGNIN
jgi:lipocalin